MSKPADILSALKTQLENSAQISYVKNVFLGDRESVTEFPCIIIEPTNINEVENVYPRQDMAMKVNIIGVIRCTNKDKQIAGDATDKGILDLLNDIELALDSDRQLGLSSGVIHSRVVNVDMGRVDYPARFIIITVEILYRQTKGTRS
ncbi:MAG TPA: hypothetical protein PKL77_10080 [Candidatus Omnitrophota bacterium]|nr:hypothetical protein [Candidatus Omnitrophota bacterium]